jgi:hypothetical protein
MLQVEIDGREVGAAQRTAEHAVEETGGCVGVVGKTNKGERTEPVKRCCHFPAIEGVLNGAILAENKLRLAGLDIRVSRVLF